MTPEEIKGVKITYIWFFPRTSDTINKSISFRRVEMTLNVIASNRYEGLSLHLYYNWLMAYSRSRGPEIKENLDIKIPQILKWNLSNGIPVYEVLSGQKEVFKIDIVHRGGRIQESKRLVNRVTTSLMKEATRNLASKELASKIDFFGASLSTKANMDQSSHAIYGLNKFASELIPILSEIIHEPAFNSSDLEKYKKRNKANLNIELRKNDVVAYREFTEDVFGPDHPYGFNSNTEMYNAISIPELERHYNSNFGINNCYMFLSGNITDEMRKSIDGLFSHRNNKIKVRSYTESITPNPGEKKSISLGAPSQSAIILGKKLFAKNHPDYPLWIVLNTILGGFFGSRLMKKIREEKGLTYNVSSFIDNMRLDGHFYVSCDVAHKNIQDTLASIHQEIGLLKTELVKEEELRMVKNYIAGNILNMLDGPFRSIKWIKSLILNDMSTDDGIEIIEEIKSASAEQVRDLAIKYLNKEDMNTVIVS